jgi:CDP-glycerol glycerophosphotransferase
MSVLSISQAIESGYREAFVTYPALGDQILLLYAARIRHEQASEKTLLGVTSPELFEHQDCCDILEGLNALSVGRVFQELNAAGITIFPATYYQPMKANDGRLCFSFPSCHILAELCSRLGISGEIRLDPIFALTDEEKTFGRFFPERQIAVMSQGKEKRKSWGAENMQAVVNLLKDRCSFVQIGTPQDAPLAGTLDKRGAFPLRRVAAVLHNSDLFVGGIGALMHLARGVACPAVITYSLSEPLPAASYPCNRNIVAEKACSACRSNMINSDNEDDECMDNFSCVRNISVSDVCSAIVEMMDTLHPSPKNYPVETAFVTECRAQALNVLTARLFGMAQSRNLLRQHRVPV